jgi:hypothetical protein
MQCRMAAAGQPFAQRSGRRFAAKERIRAAHPGHMTGQVYPENTLLIVQIVRNDESSPC